MYSSIRGLYQRLRHHWHERRAELFVELMQPEPGCRVLDLGGGSGELMGRVRARCDVDVTIADIEVDALAEAAAAGFATARLVEGQPLPFADRAFDIVFCNSVIEHATIPKDQCKDRRIPEHEWRTRAFEGQRAFADELRRVGVRYFVQTPHRGFPVEAHTWLPFVGWLSHDATARVVEVADRIWVKRCEYVDWNLLDEEGMRRLLPDCAVHVERTLGLPKSLIAYSP